MDSHSAIQTIDTDRPTLLAFRIDGKITKSAVEVMARMVDTAFKDHDEIDLLVTLTNYNGVEADAAFDREMLAVQAKSLRKVRKYAVVGAPSWASLMINLFDPLSPIDARTFDQKDEAEAWSWIVAEA